MTSEIESCGPESTYAYDQFKMQSTLVTEFDMVCDKSREVSRFIESSSNLGITQIWVPMANSCFMLGLALGSLVFGLMSDKIGRRHTLPFAVLTTRLSRQFSVFNAFFGDQHLLCGGLPDAWLCFLRSPEGPHRRRLRRMVRQYTKAQFCLLMQKNMTDK